MRQKAPILVEYHNFIAQTYYASTIELHMYIVSVFIDFCSKKRIELKKLQMSDLYHFLRRGSYSISYLNIQITVINIFISWCRSMGIIGMDSYKRIKQLENAGRRKIILSDFQFKEFNSLMHKVESRVKVLIKVLYFTGANVHEVINMRIDDISFKKSSIVIRAGKRKSIQSVPIFKELEADLKSYIKSIECDGRSFLFPKRNGGHLSQAYVYKLVSKFLRTLKGVEFGPRIIRNTRGFHLLRSHKSLIGISELFNVKVGQAVTYKYTDIINYTRLQEIYKAAHPRA